MSKKQRKWDNISPPSCSACGCTHYWVSKAFDRPLYTCANCDYSWTCGLRGGEYAGHARGYRPDLDDQYTRLKDVPE